MFTPSAFLRLTLCLVPLALRGETPPDDFHFPPFVTARAWAVADGKTGELLWGQDADVPQKAASTAKVMCAYVVLQIAAKDPAVLEERVTFSELADRTQGTTSGISAGESVPVRDCLYGLLLPSGNDAGNALAEHFNARCEPPGEEMRALGLDVPAMRTRGNFIAEINRTAARLGLKETTYRISYGDGGTPDDRTISPRDLARLGSIALRDPLLRRIVSTSSYECAVMKPDGTTRTAQWTNTNQLLAVPGCDGIKTGTTPSARACLLSSVHRRDDHLIVAVLGSVAPEARYIDTQNILRWAWQRRTAGLGPQLDADVVVKNAEVLTLDERQPRAQAFAIKDGRFVAVGSNADVARYVAPAAQMFDLAGKTVVPDTIDTHASDSLLRIQEIVTRRGGNGGALIAPSKQADFVVLSANPDGMPRERMTEIRCEMRFAEGQRVEATP